MLPEMFKLRLLVFLVKFMVILQSSVQSTRSQKMHISHFSHTGAWELVTNSETDNFHDELVESKRSGFESRYGLNYINIYFRTELGSCSVRVVIFLMG